MVVVVRRPGHQGPVVAVHLLDPRLGVDISGGRGRRVTRQIHRDHPAEVLLLLLLLRLVLLLLLLLLARSTTATAAQGRRHRHRLSLHH